MVLRSWFVLFGLHIGQLNMSSTTRGEEDTVVNSEKTAVKEFSLARPELGPS